MARRFEDADRECKWCMHDGRSYHEFPCNECSDCDLFVIDAERVAKEFGLPEGTKVDVVRAPIKDSGERREFETGAVRDMAAGKGRMDLLPWAAIIEVSKHCENGAKKYGEHNVDKGIPVHSFVDSAFRHLAKHVDGQTDEPHLIAAAWNILYAIQMEIKNPELNDIPWNRKEKEND